MLVPLVYVAQRLWFVLSYWKCNRQHASLLVRACLGTRTFKHLGYEAFRSLVTL